MSEPKQAKDNKVFIKLQKGAKPPPMDKALIASQFSKQGNLMKSKRWFVLFQDSIYYFNDEKDPNPKGYTPIDFELRFEVIREKVDKEKSPNKKKIGKPKGLCFDRDGCSCELYSTDEEQITKWRDHLRGVINQRGFHELFRAQRKIGKGNFASVYLAERLEDERMFAVKAFSKEAAFSQEKGKEALITEIELMRALDHSNIMKLHEVFETENSLYFILDLLEGGQLYDKIKLKYKFQPDEVKTIMKGLLGGLAHMHDRGIMHRDIKPENILFRKQNSFECVIADLGLGTKIDLEEYLFVRCGTPGFVAPEVVNIKDMKTTYGPVCDIFSLGLIFHILLIGKPPFNGKTYNEVLAQNRAGIVKLDGPEFLRVPNMAYDLLKKMLKKDPKERISSQEAMRHKYFAATKEAQPKAKEETKEQDTPVDLEEQNTALIHKQSKQMANVKAQILQQPVVASPKLLPRRLPQQSLDPDSCVAFKMQGSPVMTGLVDKCEDNQGGSNPQGSVFLMGTGETPLQRGRFGMSPQVPTKSPLSQLCKNGGGNSSAKNDKIRQALMMETMEQGNLQSIDENEENKEERKQNSPRNQQTQKKAQTNNIKNKLLNNI